MVAKKKTNLYLATGSLSALQHLAAALGFLLPKNLQRGSAPAGNLSLLLDALAVASERDFDGLVLVLKPFLSDSTRGHES